MAMSEVKVSGGSAHASSFWDANWDPENAFKLGHKNGWHDGKNVKVFPQLIWYNFPKEKAFVPARISFRPRNNIKFKIQGIYKLHVHALWAAAAMGWNHVEHRFEFPFVCTSIHPFTLQISHLNPETGHLTPAICHLSPDISHLDLKSSFWGLKSALSEEKN